jgi:hypothetical protein
MLVFPVILKYRSLGMTFEKSKLPYMELPCTHNTGADDGGSNKSETSVSFYQIALRSIRGDRRLRHRENLKSHLNEKLLNV